MSASESTCLAVLQLLQLADSALPIGSLSHSFGLETMAFDGDIATTVHDCPPSLRDYLKEALCESLLLDAVYCREAHARAFQCAPVTDLNEQLSALRLARESREASLVMGRRFAALAAALQPAPALCALAGVDELHHSIAFGYVLGVLQISADFTVSAFLNQYVLNTVSAAQRLLPLGQIQANRIVWDLKPAIVQAVDRTRGITVEDARSFAHLPEVASMRHACLPTRLFVS